MSNTAPKAFSAGLPCAFALSLASICCTSRVACWKRASFHTSGLAAERWPLTLKEVMRQGHEIVGHGWANDELNRDDDPDRELAEIRRCTQAL